VQRAHGVAVRHTGAGQLSALLAIRWVASQIQAPAHLGAGLAFLAGAAPV